MNKQELILFEFFIDKLKHSSFDELCDHIILATNFTFLRIPTGFDKDNISILAAYFESVLWESINNKAQEYMTELKRLIDDRADSVRIEKVWEDSKIKLGLLMNK